jgi:arylsulfatase A-like enzyme
MTENRIFPVSWFFYVVFLVFLAAACKQQPDRPNLIFVFADEWRGQATGYMGDPNAHTPNLDALASRGIIFTTAVSGCPVCSPYRASLLTGQFPLTHGVFYNDKPLRTNSPTIAEVFKKAGYQTAYIGKWHLNGHQKGQSRADGRRSPVPAERRFGFDFWKVCECTHDYNHSIYFDENDSLHIWQDYDAIAQTRTAQNYIEAHGREKPFILFISWGPPHDPYDSAPESYRARYSNTDKIQLRPNVPQAHTDIAREKLSGYYAHIAALDDCLGDLLQTISDSGLEENTIFVFTADHGDMLYSHGLTKKQKPWDESILVPFVLRFPPIQRTTGRTISTPINTPDIMPTLLGLCGLEVPATVEGEDLSDLLKGSQPDSDRAVLLSCPVPFHQWNYRIGGKEYRGIRTKRYTYVCDLQGPWLLFDNLTDPYQTANLVNKTEQSSLQTKLEKILTEKLNERNDQFSPGMVYMKKWDYDWDEGDAPDVNPLIY